MSNAERRYRLGPLERRGLVAGWRAGQIAVVAVACALAGAVVAVSIGSLALVAAVALVGAGVAAATIPVSGRALDEWIPSLAAFAVGRRRRSLLACQILDAGAHGGRAGVGVILQRSGALSVTVALDSSGISLLEGEAKDRRVEGLVAALGALAREGCLVDRVAWSSSAAPDPGVGLVRDSRRRGARGVAMAVTSYRTLLGAAIPHGLERRVCLTLRTSPIRASAQRRAGVIAALLDEASVVAPALEDAGHRRCRLLSSSELAEHLGADDVEPDGHLEVAGTMRFAHLEVADQLVVSWWVAEWPRTEVTAELLAPLLLGGVARAMAVIFEPVAPSAALRKAATARTSEIADAEIRRRGGFLADRRQQRQHEHTAARETELVDGHGSLRMSGYVTVTARNGEELDRMVVETELAAAQSRLVLRRLDGDHARGFLATRPLGGGLP